MFSLDTGRAARPGSGINDVHLKGASRDGDVDIDTLFAVLPDTGWSGWLVVEQDTLPTMAERFVRATDDQRANRAFPSARGLQRGDDTSTSVGIGLT